MNQESTTAPGTSSLNGCIRIARKGIVKFAFGDDPEFQIDAIAVYDEWYQVDASMRDEKGVLATDKTCAWNEMRRTFVQNIVKDGYARAGLDGAKVPILSHTEVSEFMARLQDEVGKLRLFFAPASSGPQSSPVNTELRFSK